MTGVMGEIKTTRKSEEKKERKTKRRMTGGFLYCVIVVLCVNINVNSNDTSNSRFGMHLGFGFSVRYVIGTAEKTKVIQKHWPVKCWHIK